MPARSLRPLVIAGAVALSSTGLLVLAVALEWLGPDVGRGARFCEVADGTVLQPANAASNIGFVVAGLVVAWHAGAPATLGDVLPRYRGLATAYACVVVLLGPGSAAMHATQAELGGDLDQLSMYLVAAFAAAYAVTRWLRQGMRTFVQLFLLMVAACQLVGLYEREVPVVAYAGNVAFGVLLVTALVIEGLLHRRGPTRTDLRYCVIAAGVLLLALVIWLAGQRGVCDPRSPLQAHAAWHLLCAVSAYLLFRFWASERNEVSPAAAPAPPGSALGGRAPGSGPGTARPAG